MEKKITKRKFKLVNFKDKNNVSGSIQMSSLATDECIWFGCDDVDPQYFIPYVNPSWRKLEKPQGSTEWVFNSRMHLNRKQVAKLIPILQKFVKKGTIY